MDYLEEREKKEVQLSVRELAELKKTELEMKKGEFHTLEVLAKDPNSTQPEIGRHADNSR